jgi:two-component sensor histidine kinase
MNAQPLRPSMLAVVITAYWLLCAVTLTIAYAPLEFLDLRGAVLSALIDTASLVMVWLAAYAAAARLPLVGPRAPVNLLLTLAAAVLVLSVRVWLLRELMTPLGWFGGRTLVGAARDMLPGNLATFAIFWMGGWALLHFRRGAELQLRSATLRLSLLDAQLTALMSRLHPHFIGNALNSVATLIFSAPAAARTSLARLRRVIAAAMRHARDHEVRLDDELKFVEDWLGIQQERFSDRLTVSLDIDAAARDARVPGLILQPLVENALKHAVAPLQRPVHVAIRARVDGRTLRLQVVDDGPGLGHQATTREGGSSGSGGVGTANTRQRLAVLYGSNARLLLRNRSGGGVVAEVRLPFLLQPVTAPGTRQDEATGQVDEATEALPAAPRVALLAVGLLLLAVTGHLYGDAPVDGVTGAAWALAMAALFLGAALVPAAVAFRLSRMAPVAAGSGVPVQLAVAVIVLALASAIGTTALVVGGALLRGQPVQVPTAVLATQSASMWLMQLNVLAAARVAQHRAAQDRQLRALREQAASVLDSERARMEARLDVRSVYAAFDRIDVAIGVDPHAASRELSRLAGALMQSARDGPGSGVRSGSAT